MSQIPNMSWVVYFFKEENDRHNNPLYKTKFVLFYRTKIFTLRKWITKDLTSAAQSRMPCNYFTTRRLQSIMVHQRLLLYNISIGPITRADIK